MHVPSLRVSTVLQDQRRIVTGKGTRGPPVPDGDRNAPDRIMDRDVLGSGMTSWLDEKSISAATPLGSGPAPTSRHSFGPADDEPISPSDDEVNVSDRTVRRRRVSGFPTSVFLRTYATKFSVGRGEQWALDHDNRIAWVGYGKAATLHRDRSGPDPGTLDQQHQSPQLPNDSRPGEGVGHLYGQDACDISDCSFRQSMGKLPRTWILNLSGSPLASAHTQPRM